MEGILGKSRLQKTKPILRNRKLCANITSKIKSSLKDNLSDAGSTKSSGSNKYRVRLYKSILDLRNGSDIMPAASNVSTQATQRSLESISTDQKMEETLTAKDKTVSERCMKITTYACTQNTFDTATSIITERIISKQLELEREKKCTRRLLQRNGKMPTKIDDVLVERIIEKEDELKNKKLTNITPSTATAFVRSVKFLEEEDKSHVPKVAQGESQATAKQKMEPPKPVKKPTINARDIVNANKKMERAKTSILKLPTVSNGDREGKSNSFKKVNRSSKLYKSLPDLASDTKKKSLSSLSPSKIPKCITLPKFVLSCRPAGRVTVNHMATQDNIKNEQCSIYTQTMTDSDDFSIQTNIVSKKSDQSIQAQLLVSINTEWTNTIPVTNFSRYTSTLKQSDIVEQTQMVEYMTGNDLYCLEWVRDYLFDINFDHRQIIVGDKLKEVSEVGTTTTLI